MDSFKSKPIIELLHRYNKRHGHLEDYWIIFFKFGDDVLYSNLGSNTLSQIMSMIRNMSNDMSVYRHCPINIQAKEETELIDSWDDETLIYITLKYT
jgi:hypothetical protein